MKFIKYLTVILVASLMLVSCKKIKDEVLPMTFAVDVVVDMFKTDINPSVYAYTWAYKANLWYEAMGDEALQNEIEDLYFDQKEPRMYGDTLEILETYYSDKIYIITHGSSLASGSTWEVINSNNYHANVKHEISLNEDGSCNLVRTMDEHQYTLAITHDELTGVIIVAEGSGETLLVRENSPVVGQHFEVTSPIVYQNFNDIEIERGELFIQLLSNDGVIEGDDINAVFVDNYSDYETTYLKVFFRGNESIQSYYYSFRY